MACFAVDLWYPCTATTHGTSFVEVVLIALWAEISSSLARLLAVHESQNSNVTTSFTGTRYSWIDTCEVRSMFRGQRFSHAVR